MSGRQLKSKDTQGFQELQEVVLPEDFCRANTVTEAFIGSSWSEAAGIHHPPEAFRRICLLTETGDIQMSVYSRA